MPEGPAFLDAPWRPDRAGREAAWQRVQQRDPGIAFLPLLESQPRLSEDRGLLLLDAHQVEHWLARAHSISLLGEHAQRTVFALDLPGSAALGGMDADLRQAAAELPREEASLLAAARALAHWHRAHRHCGSCGAATLAEEAGLLRRCSRCETPSFPRVDPAVIVLVHDAADARCLLGRHRDWPEHRYSTIAGFVEPGESLESCVAREVQEETAVRCHQVRYLASQPWPFPASLMLGFEAVGEGEPRPLDGELARVGWFSRDDIRAGLAAGRFALPHRCSIAFELIRRWFDRGGQPLDELVEHAG